MLAVDLEDRVEFWNSQMEVMYALPRWQALGKKLIAKSSRPQFLEEFYRVRTNPGIHNLYKFRLTTPAGETRDDQHRHRAAGHANNSTSSAAWSWWTTSPSASSWNRN